VLPEKQWSTDLHHMSQSRESSCCPAGSTLAAQGPRGESYRTFRCADSRDRIQS
jgi:hypothetical protein